MTGATATESSRDQIIHAAADSLLENGYSGTSVRAIATKAGVAIGNLQYWFPTKSELLVEAWRYLTSRSVNELRRTLNQLTDPLEVLEIGVESLWDSLRQLGDIQLAAFDLLVQAPRTERLRAYLPELFTRYREVIQEQLDRLEEDGRIRLTVPRDVLVPLVLNTVLGFGLYYVVTRDDESCLKALSAFRQLAGSLVLCATPAGSFARGTRTARDPGAGKSAHRSAGRFHGVRTAGGAGSAGGPGAGGPLSEGGKWTPPRG
jgi:AcrR family transcriptional regulator